MSEAHGRGLPESNRVEAFSDGVLAIAVTLLVLDLRADFDRGSFAHELGAQWPSRSSSSAWCSCLEQST